MSRASTSVQQLQEGLRQQILDGTLPPGLPLREVELAQRFAVSRHTVRTALTALAGTGLVQAVPFAGVRVVTFDRAAAEAVQDLRRALESEAVEILHRRYPGGVWPAEVVEPIRAAVDALGIAERAGDDLAVLRAHAAVHGALVDAAGSERITAAHRQLSDELQLLLRAARPAYRPGELQRQHLALLQAVQTEGVAPLRNHLDDTLERLQHTTSGTAH